MLLQAKEAFLLIIDMQEKLVPHIHEHERVTENCLWLLQLALALDIPVLASEQYPQGLGPTLPVLKREIPESHIREKVEFSCCENQVCFETIAALNKQQVIIAGIESHVCVLQTAIEFIEYDREVFIVEEAVGSRNPHDKALALERMRQWGVEILSREMVLFELLRSKEHPQFKALTQRFIKR